MGNNKEIEKEKNNDIVRAMNRGFQELREEMTAGQQALREGMQVGFQEAREARDGITAEMREGFQEAREARGGITAEMREGFQEAREARGGITAEMREGFQEAREAREDFARMVQEGFQGFSEEMNKRFDAQDAELALIKNRLDTIETQIMRIQKDLKEKASYGELHSLRARVAQLEDELADIKKQLA